jgi:protoheme IX farnesyltransferase
MLKKYLEAVKPERTFFNVMMTAAGFVYAAHWHIHWALALATIAGTSLLVMSGCLTNNATDAQVDAVMPRTRRRASAKGEIPVRNLVVLAVVLGVAGLGVLFVWVNTLVVWLGVVAYVDYTALYAWTKRTTPLSTLAGTPAGSLPLAAGYVAVVDRFNTTALLLTLVMAAWQMAHFYAIGIYRLKDYKVGGLPIWPARYGVRNTQMWILGFICAFILLAELLNNPVFTVVALAGLYWLYHSIKGIRTDKAEAWARGSFGVSLWVLLVFAAALCVAPALA